MSLELINFIYGAMASGVVGNVTYDGIKALLGVSFGQFLGYVKNDDKKKFQERLDELLESNEKLKNKLMDLKSQSKIVLVESIKELEYSHVEIDKDVDLDSRNSMINLKHSTVKIGK